MTDKSELKNCRALIRELTSQLDDRGLRERCIEYAIRGVSGNYMSIVSTATDIEKYIRSRRK